MSPLGPNVKIIADGRARYPDALVVCRPVSPTATVADDPVVVFKVLSEGSSETDLIDKNREYRATPSIQRYVVLQQTHKAAIVFARRQDGWLSEISQGMTPGWICRKSVSRCHCTRCMRTWDCPKCHKRERRCDGLADAGISCCPRPQNITVSSHLGMHRLGPTRSLPQ